MPSDTTEEPQMANDAWDMTKRLNISTMSHTFANFKVEKGTEEIYDTMKLLSEREYKKFVFLYGTTGNGKTFLIEALILAWAQKAIYARYQTNSQLMRLLKRCMNPNSIPSYDEMFDKICKQDRLIIDDVGMGTTEGTWELSTLEDIISERYQKRYYPHPVITIMATNKDITQIPDRITSRFYDPEIGTVILNKALDFRRRK